MEVAVLQEFGEAPHRSRCCHDAAPHGRVARISPRRSGTANVNARASQSTVTVPQIKASVIAGGILPLSPAIDQTIMALIICGGLFNR
jgi:hypothetical protein